MSNAPQNTSTGETLASDARCAATIWKRDTYRRTGRGKSGFEMHYNQCRCSRRATQGKWCWQHSDGTFLDWEDR